MNLSTSDVAVVLLYGLPLTSLFGVQYLALRVRNARADDPDPQLGRKAAAHFFLSLYVFVALAGLTLSALDWADYAADLAEAGRPPPAPPPGGTPPPPPGPRELFNSSQRTAAGLLLSGLVHGAIFWAVLRVFTNDREFPAVGRAFAGVRFVLAGLVAMTCSTWTLVIAFQKDTEIRTVLYLTAVGVVWGPAAAGHLVLLLWSSGWRAARLGEPDAGAPAPNESPAQQTQG